MYAAISRQFIPILNSYSLHTLNITGTYTQHYISIANFNNNNNKKKKKKNRSVLYTTTMFLKYKWSK